MDAATKFIQAVTGLIITSSQIVGAFGTVCILIGIVTFPVLFLWYRDHTREKLAKERIQQYKDENARLVEENREYRAFVFKTKELDDETIRRLVSQKTLPPSSERTDLNSSSKKILLFVTVPVWN
jgi:hypothetical protein